MICALNSESQSSPPPPRGVEHPHVIDMIAHDPETDVVTLTMFESRPWNGSDLQIFQLQEKFNAYVSFALDGEMAEAYPALVDKRLQLCLECVAPPEETVLHFLKLVREQVAFQGIDVQVIVTGGNCGCRVGSGTTSSF